VLNEAEARAFLASRFGNDGADVALIGEGAWSRAYGFRRGDEDLVIRFGALDEDFRKDHFAARFASSALPIPSVFEIGEAEGGHYAISRRAHGSYLDDLDGEPMRALLPALFAMLDAARLADLSATSGYGIWGADGNAPHPTWHAALLDIANDHPANRTHGWKEKFAASSIGTAPFETALARLKQLTPFLPNERHLIHSDLLNFNVLVEGQCITAVIDWGNALYGDFLYDLAWFCFWQPWFPAWHGIDFRREAQRHYAAIGLDVPHVAERLAACQIHIGLDSQAYCAFRERWDMLEEVAARTLAVTIP
jgi:hygromycin-B 4-O-kinase